ncbi:CsbD family protein [Caenimonas sedimenti]|uniref:CsbD family protein n=1 Tax=Caenimonas sedimenti TaxID=2596921 RepID=A0A562ZWV4_9BURK|nr:CsbD family protein [Caenimonas sedimenti]TWO72634.1 CsbD family protein [Caenimonas sedimenti]
MNQDRLEGRWKQLKGKVKEQWGKLTDDDLDVIAGRRDQLLGRIQQRHGLARDDAHKQVKQWEESHPDHRLEPSRAGDFPYEKS